ncbi:hypothetical protein J7E81_15540 [Bacillus sp. ISL-18]|uniref:hypothetical protein n=1 Tax=Bacillus sp. ISL-18 TaxID=2819118 RepID=UPI001BE6AD8B|nr:hypothetical protein [Bacillus sp. ISL-18]MBT2656632.1 hypothetical protein [Bacillus sp. ISL-18]
MTEYQIHLVLKSGKQYSYLTHLKDVEAYKNEIQDIQSSKWFSFVSDDFIKYSVDKHEIVCIGISMSKDEIIEQNKRNAENENVTQKRKIVQNKAAKTFTHWE